MVVDLFFENSGDPGKDDRVLNGRDRLRYPAMCPSDLEHDDDRVRSSKQVGLPSEDQKELPGGEQRLVHLAVSEKWLRIKACNWNASRKSAERASESSGQSQS
ncbi:unnamed protein product [Soboliphyme baturini]|uniref:Uncharacterized protein n=1 Tax=Soboliphyme baturini TaxID=241478 RepID=A0A183ITB5_9BILA|nr:unnamed protein product [Soboliphyme baturini]